MPVRETRAAGQGEIGHCTRCRWLARAHAGWLRSSLGAFEGDLGEVAFVPAPEGVFMIGSTGRLSGDSTAEGFPERAAVKRGVWDRVAPGRDTGRPDRQDAQEH
jgi:predicted Rdx family selenoprotein